MPLVILFRYLLQAILLRLALALPALVMVYLAFDLGDEGRRLALAVGWPRVLRASLLHAPLVAIQVLPAALLVAALLAIGRLRANGELEAMALAGWAPLRSLLPLLTAGLLAALFALLLGELVAPRCEHQADRLLGLARASPLTGEGPPAGWLRQGRWFLKLTPHPRGGAHVLGLEHDGRFAARRELEGELGTDGQLRARVRSPGASGTTAPATGLPSLALEQRELVELALRPEALSAAGLRRRLRALRTSGRARPVEELLLQAHLAFPALNLVLALIAWPFALRDRGRSLLLDLGQGLLWLLGLFTLLALGWLAARAGWLSPAAGTWLPLGIGMLPCLVRALLAGRAPRGGWRDP